MRRTIPLLFLCAAALFGGKPTPAEAAVSAAMQTIAREPANAEHHAALAMALTRRARETSDFDYYARAEESVAKALEIDRDNFQALKARCWVLLGRHEFAQALELAKKLNQRTPDDVAVYGFLTDAYVELGNYQAAEESAQWMLDMGRSSIPALTRAAYLRELFGDLDGALELMNKAYTRMDLNESEDRAWALVQIGHLLTLAGKPAEAAQAIDAAFELVPEYHYALATKARLRASQGLFDEAIQLFQRRYRLAPHPENLFEVGNALWQAGRKEEARQILEKFESLALAESEGWDNANRELIAYYCDIASRPEDGLRIAEREIGRRKDVHTLDAYAWALFQNGRAKDAREYIEKAVAVGTIDPTIRAHAEAIRVVAEIDAEVGDER